MKLEFPIRIRISKPRIRNSIFETILDIWISIYGYLDFVIYEYTRLKVNQKLILLLNHVGILSKKLIAAVKWKPCYLFFHGTNFNGRIENTIVFYMKLIAAEVKLCYVFSVKPFSIVKSRRPELLREIDCGFCIFSREINFKSDQRRVEEYPNFYMKLIAAEWSTYIAFVQIFCCKY